MKQKYTLTTRETGDRLSDHFSLEEAENELERQENEDIANGNFLNDFYQIAKLDENDNLVYL